MTDEYYMEQALNQARKAFALDEVPIGCIIVCNGRIIAKSYNRKTLDNVATYHAEILAINEACKKLGTWYLDECVLYTTIEPCLMCTGAIMQSRIKRVVYGSKNEAFGYLSKVDLKIDVRSNVLEKETKDLLTNFFKDIRQKN